ncbi:hypothetical protein [Pedobacter sp. CFBP9032]|uniref:hypothetical protein n=1 Tax=Pedobacter sp. CFBP9032 TaxID=3096539 RepID=UPI002A6B690F|nr:hypothetical protein [Pedobacter sp. CFBP9032]MDY0904530.1 hypothetical protein [Pedobacter sp. CFBP9032]
MEILLKYHGLDWLSMLLSFGAMLLLGNKVKWGFVFFILANITMIVVSYLMIGSIALVVGNAIFLVTNIRGFTKWNTSLKTENN